MANTNKSKKAKKNDWLPIGSEDPREEDSIAGPDNPPPRTAEEAGEVDYNESSSSYGYGGWGHDE